MKTTSSCIDVPVATVVSEFEKKAREGMVRNEFGANYL
jgi:hypothetical protein